MPLFDDFITYELCFPGAVTRATEVECPNCGELLTVPVDDPMGEESFHLLAQQQAPAVTKNEALLDRFNNATHRL